MLGVCEIHKSRKRGYCSDCGVCRCCDPSSACRIKDNHVNWKRKVKDIGTTIEQQPKSAKLTPRRGKRPSSLRGKRRLILDEDPNSDADQPHPNYYGNHPVPTMYCCNKDTLSLICDILGIDQSILVCPNNGFTKQAMDTETRALQRGSRIVRQITSSICELVSPSNTKFKNRFY